jgi:predicted transcriptional regulator
MAYRSRTEISAVLLEAAVEGEKKTVLMYKSYLAHNHLKDYLQVLTANELLAYESENRIYRTTNKGKEFLKLYSQADKIMLANF